MSINKIEDERIETPPIVRIGKQLTEDGIRLEPWNRDERPYFCRTCGTIVKGVYVPSNWYALSIHMGRLRSHRLGLFCSIECLLAQIPRIDGIGRALGEDWINATGALRQSGEDE